MIDPWARHGTTERETTLASLRRLLRFRHDWPHRTYGRRVHHVLARERIAELREIDARDIRTQSDTCAASGGKETT